MNPNLRKNDNVPNQCQDQGQGQGQDQKWRQQMALTLTLTLVLALVRNIIIFLRFGSKKKSKKFN